MIIGNGDIAGALVDREGILYFASGVSNSRETRESEYLREKNLLMTQPKDKRLVYFGTLACFYNPNTRYAQHKREMEALVKTHFTHYTIVRLGNITWGNNPNTLINSFRTTRRKGAQIQIQDTSRYLVTKKEFLHWIELIPDWNCEMNITGTRMKVSQIVKRYVK